MRRLMIALVALLGAVPLSAQQRIPVSCPASDSTYGHWKERTVSWYARHDRLTDSTTFTGRRQGLGVNVLSSSRLEAEFFILSSGKNRLTPDALVFILVSSSRNGVSTPASGGLLGKATPLQFLVDDTLRFQLEPRGGGETADNSGGGLVPPYVSERFEYPVSDEDLRRIAAARTGVVGIATFRSDLKKSLIDGAMEILRAKACSPP